MCESHEGTGYKPSRKEILNILTLVIIPLRVRQESRIWERGFVAASPITNSSQPHRQLANRSAMSHQVKGLAQGTRERPGLQSSRSDLTFNRSGSRSTGEEGI
jgi:cytochrome oxidase assembly protein ShyY1